MLFLSKKYDNERFLAIKNVSLFVSLFYGKQWFPGIYDSISYHRTDTQTKTTGKPYSLATNDHFDIVSRCQTDLYHPTSL